MGKEIYDEFFDENEKEFKEVKFEETQELTLEDMLLSQPLENEEDVDERES